ncbi:DUF3558 domain-containing protein [Actinokineospora pegani]|uniref:DUF3558 domain-containing protein n=1 Tax=Actinokineospora pegani TaxID=2654637 RepID=UPI0018D3F8A7|nr:DUF3558 domain-containing protein [Actinokineospora pegani]
MGTVVLLGTGCSTQTPGQPIPAEDVSTSAATEPTTSTTGALDPCSLLTADAKAELGVSGSGDPDELPSGKSCAWQVSSAASGGNGFVLGTAVFPEFGLEQVSSSGPTTEITVGSRRALKSTGAGGSVFAISLEVTPSSRVDVSSTIGGAGEEEAWARVQRLAELVEPQLP